MSVPSPCIDVCCMDAASGLCAGCLRTGEEIAGWAAAPDEQKRLILTAIAQRRARRDAAPESLHGDCDE
jgi:uncharacterized protein